jgi:hypothetical protein
MERVDGSVDMSFCDGCVFRGQEIAPGTVCARSALDNVRLVFGSIAALNAEVPGHPAIDAHNRETEETFAGMFTQDVANCIESVSNGGEPIVSSDEF